MSRPDDSTPKPKVKRVKTGALERRFSMARAGILASARYATLSASTVFTPKERRAERQKEILSQQAEWLVKELGKLKGSIVKVGQMMALLGEHFLPDEITAALHTLEDSTTALEWPAIERLLRQELGETKLAELEINPEPIGAASLGQVHRAIRRRDGKPLCLKIQYPGVAQAIDSDLAALVSLLKLTRLVPITDEFNAWLDEVHAMLSREVDYDLELHTTQHFQQLLADDPRYIVPDVFPEYSTNDVLCTSFMEGVGVSDPSIMGLPQERRNFIGKAIMELCCHEVFTWNKMQTDPNFGNYLIQKQEETGLPHDRIVLLDFGAIRDFDDSILGPGREMIYYSYFHDAENLIKSFQKLNFLNKGAPKKLLDEFAELCFMGVEVLQDPDRYPPPPHVLNERKEYLWARSDLPTRITTAAAKSAFSAHFDVPPKEFIFLSRKLLGAYTFLHVIGAEVRGNEILDPFLKKMNETQDLPKKYPL